MNRATHSGDGWRRQCVQKCGSHNSCSIGLSAAPPHLHESSAYLPFLYRYFHTWPHPSITNYNQIPSSLSLKQYVSLPPHTSLAILVIKILIFYFKRNVCLISQLVQWFHKFNKILFTIVSLSLNSLGKFSNQCINLRGFLLIECESLEKL